MTLEHTAQQGLLKRVSSALNRQTAAERGRMRGADVATRRSCLPVMRAEPG